MKEKILMDRDCLHWEKDPRLNIVQDILTITELLLVTIAISSCVLSVVVPASYQRCLPWQALCIECSGVLARIP